MRWVRERYPDLRTILTSGVIDEGPPPSLGDVDAVLPKPYSVDDLSRAIARALDAQGRAAARPDVEA